MKIKTDDGLIFDNIHEAIYHFCDKRQGYCSGYKIDFCPLYYMKHSCFDNDINPYEITKVIGYEIIESEVT